MAPEQQKPSPDNLADAAVAPDAAAPLVPDHTMVRRIGSGSYGAVWLARSVTGAWRAVKVVHRADFESERPYEREFQGILKFEPVSRTDESQVDILHVGRNDTGGYFYYVMELADDASAAPGTPAGSVATPGRYEPRTLKHELRSRRRLPLEACLDIGLKLTAALDHLHAQGLVHRDIKPANIIFAGGVPKLADIGLVTDADATRTHVGTEGYLPPEGSGTPDADLYSLGKVLYEISTGKDRKEFPEAPTDLGEGAERMRLLEFSEIVEKACAPRPADRYQTAAAIRADLALLREGGSVRRKRRLAFLGRWAALAAAALAAAAVLVAGGKALLRPQGKPAPGTTNLEAYKAYQLGRFHWNKRTATAMTNAIQEFQRAIALDPKYAEAHVGVSDACALLMIYVPKASEYWTRRRRAAVEEALAINPRLAQARLALAALKRDLWDWAGAETEFRTALELDPNYATTHQWHARLLNILGRHEEAVAAARRAVDLDPASLSINANLGARLKFARRYEEAERQYRRTIALDPNFPVAHREYSSLLFLMQRPAEAVAEVVQSRRLMGLPEAEIGALTAAWEKGGETGFWRFELAKAEQSSDPIVGLWDHAEIHTRLGQRAEALEVLEAAFARREPSLSDIAFEPSLDALRSEPRFQALLKGMGLPVGAAPANPREPATSARPTGR